MAPPFRPIKQIDLIHYLRQAGFVGPFSGGKHSFMKKADLIITIPNPHNGSIGKELLLWILKQARISKKEWEAL